MFRVPTAISGGNILVMVNKVRPFLGEVSELRGCGGGLCLCWETFVTVKATGQPNFCTCHKYMLKFVK